jgi:hypothetical protein
MGLWRTWATWVDGVLLVRSGALRLWLTPLPDAPFRTVALSGLPDAPGSTAADPPVIPPG